MGADNKICVHLTEKQILLFISRIIMVLRSFHHSIISQILLILLTARYCQGYFITIDANDEECFYDRVKKGTKMGLIFEVAEGGSLDIDVRIEGPDGKDIHSGERETNGKYTFASHLDGVYKYCFSNQMSTTTSKVVMFNMEIGDAPEESADEAVDHNKLEEQV